ncbi:MAG: molybdopterin-guanine dinucleotide biosynthesis protein B [Campylobacterales bacterium]|nr:molybdopterin-guanine dinucleotide biosynthesis protein B [Campylobacterales bacterium]
MAKAVAFTGVSNSGKTTLIEKISQKLSQKMRVCIIKNDPKDKAVFDTKGKDSHKFYESGADVVVVSSTRTTLFSHRSMKLEGIVRMLGDFDLLLVEGLKTLQLPRICVARDTFHAEYLGYSEALAVDKSLKKEDLPKDIDILDLNDIDTIIDWIEKNAKEI